MGATIRLGNDPTLNPDGIDVSAEMVDEGIEPQATTDFKVTITNKSNTALTNYQIFVNKVTIPPPPPGTNLINVIPNMLTIPRLDVGETETVHFLAQNPDPTTQTEYTFSVKSSYFGGAVTHTYNNFVKP